jgi:hypothetical protein
MIILSVDYLPLICAAKKTVFFTMATTYLTAQFVEHRISSIPAAAIQDNWGVERSGQFYQLDLKMCQISSLHFDFQWGSSKYVNVYVT